MSDVTIDHLRLMLSYNPDTGRIRWKRMAGETPQWNARNGGMIAGHIGANGYRRISIKRKRYQSGRIAWAIFHGEWPPLELEIDHINCDRADDRICNLRLSTSRENNGNRRSLRNKTGLKGVRVSREKFHARIMLASGKRLNLGTFETPEAAHQAYMAAAHEHFGQFARAR